MHSWLHWSTNVHFFIDIMLTGACVRISSYFANDISWWTSYFISLKCFMRLIRFWILIKNLLFFVSKLSRNKFRKKIVTAPLLILLPLMLFVSDWMSILILFPEWLILKNVFTKVESMKVLSVCVFYRSSLS